MYQINWKYNTNADLTSCESRVLLAVLIEIPIAYTCPVELLGQNAQENRSSQRSGHMRLQRSAHSHVDILVASVNRLQIAQILRRYQVQEALPTVRSWQAAELTEIVVAGQTMISVSLNVNGTKITAERTVSSEQEVPDLRVEVDVGQLLGLGGQPTGQWVVVVVNFDDRRSVEPVAQTKWTDASPELRDEAGRIKMEFIIIWSSCILSFRSNVFNNF